MNAPLARVVTKVDDKNSARTVYHVRASTAQLVQDAIDTICSQVDVAFGGVPGQAHFIGPTRIDNEWGAAGVVLIQRCDA